MSRKQGKSKRRKAFQRHPLEGRTVAICLPGDTFTDGCVVSLVNLVVKMRDNGISSFFSMHRAADMNNCRNKITLATAKPSREAQPFDGLHYDWMLWIDSDMVFRFEDFERLAMRDLEIVGGAYASDAQNLVCGFLTDEGNAKLHVENIASDEVIEVDWIGFGFLLIKRGVMERIGFPWFEHRMVEYTAKAAETHTSEDVAFCDKARKDYGLKVHLDLTVPLGHQKRTTFDLPAWRRRLREQQRRAGEDESA